METEPVFGSRFFGREDSLELLEKRLQGFLKGYRQNLGIVGKKSVGKSSLLREFSGRLRGCGAVPILVDIAGEPFEYFARKWVGGLLTGYLLAEERDSFPGVLELLREVRSRLPLTYAKLGHLRKLVKRKNWEEAFKRLLDFPESLHQETGKKVVLMIDHFDRLSHLPVSHPFRELGKSIMVQRDTMFVLAGSQLRKSMEIFRDHLSLLFGHFEILEVRNFDFQTSFRWMKQRLSPTEVPVQLKHYLMALTDGHPYFLDVILDRMARLAAEHGFAEGGEALLHEALEAELFSRQGRLYQYFLMVLRGLGSGKQFSALLGALVALARGSSRLSLQPRFVQSRRGDLKTALQRLVDQELIEKRGSLYRMNLPLFGFWLREVFQRREMSPAQDLTVALNAFRKGFEADLRAFAEAEKRELPQRVEELFKRFRNDLMEIDERKFQCPAFDQVHSKPSNGRVFPVEARARSTSWVCQVVEQEAKEEDVRFFLSETERAKKEMRKRILIALEGMELNATLLAKQFKIQIWGLRELNLLMDLYGCPKVIR